jgi:hypothetical protein
MEPATSKPTNQSPLLWVLLVLLVSAAAGVGGYFLGRESKNDSPSSTPTPQEQQTGLAEFCSKEHCIEYDAAKWQLSNLTTADIKEYGDVIRLERTNHSSSAEIHFSTFNELGGECGNCYVYPVEIISHPKVANLSIVRILSYQRTAKNTVTNVRVGFYVMDRFSMGKYKLKAGQEPVARGGFLGTYWIEDGTDQPIVSMLYWQDAKIYRTISEGKDVLELRPDSDANEAYAVLASYHKQTP